MKGPVHLQQLERIDRIDAGGDFGKAHNLSRGSRGDGRVRHPCQNVEGAGMWI
jgi:hypothetical protein